jgi:hypothetical protein
MASNTNISIDEKALANAREIQGNAIMVVTAFERDFVSQAGSTHLRPTLGNGNYLDNRMINSEFEGPALVLAATQNYSVEGLMRMNPTAMAAQATVIKQRFLGEVLLNAVSQPGPEIKTRSIKGSVTAEQVRLVVSLGLGITLGLTFIALAIAAISLSLLTHPSRRPLSLRTDPSESSTAASMLQDRATATHFDNLDRGTAKDIDSALRDEVSCRRTKKLGLATLRTPSNGWTITRRLPKLHRCRSHCDLRFIPKAPTLSGCICI